MPNVTNYAETWEKEILETMIQGTLCSPFITSNVKWLSAKTFHFTQMSTTGYKPHSRNGGWNRGIYNQVDVPFTLYHDRDVEFLVDKADVDESNQTAAIKNVAENFVETQSNPEMDAEFFSKLYEVAHGASLASATAIGTWTVDNVLTRLKAMFKAGRMRAYKQEGSLLAYVSSDIMDLLELSSTFQRKIEMTSIADGGVGYETRVTNVDGVDLLEVVDTERFNTSFDFTAAANSGDGGFEPTATAVPINVAIASMRTAKKVPKLSSIYWFAPGTHTVGDGYLYQSREYSGTFVFPNNKTNAIDSVFVDIDAAALEVPSTVR